MIPEDIAAIDTVEYQARVAAQNRPCDAMPCVKDFPGMPSRWCSGCLIAALLERLSDGWTQQPSGLRGDPDVPRTSGDDTRDTAFNSLQQEHVRLTEAIRHLQEKWRESAKVLARASGNSRNGERENALTMEGSLTLNWCADNLAGLLSLPRSSTAQKTTDAAQ